MSPRATIVRLTQTGSTNKDAMRLALQGEPLPLWVTAERQTSGRGRQGRSWTSIPGNLHASVAFSTSAPLETVGQIALVAGLMFFDAVATVTKLDHDAGLRLKWPNDLLIGHEKVGGILVESTLTNASGGAVMVVIGFGLNIVQVPDLDRPVTSLAMHGKKATAEIVVAALAECCETWLDTWNEGRGFSIIRAHWLERGGRIGEAVTINTGRCTVTGTYQGLSATGSLLVQTADGLEDYNFGDVALGV